jgi:hypothetical protein
LEWSNPSPAIAARAGPRDIQFAPGMPESWKSWLRNAVYWDGELDTN